MDYHSDSVTWLQESWLLENNYIPRHIGKHQHKYRRIGDLISVELYLRV